MNTTKRATKAAQHKPGRPPENRIKLSLTPLELAGIIERLDSAFPYGEVEDRFISLRHKLIAKGIDAGALRIDGSLA